MPFEPSKRLQALPPYLFIEIDRKKREAIADGKDVINLGVGDPDKPTPEFIRKRMVTALDDPRNHRYPFDEGVPEFRCVGLVDNVRKKAQALAEEHFAEEDPAIYTDHAAMLKEVRPQAVIVSTPHTLHFRHGYDALSAGAHVMIEKPMVTDADDARKLVARAKAKRRVLQVAVQGTYTDTFAYARKLLSDGTVGALQLVTGIMAQDWMALTRGRWRQNPRRALLS